MVKALRSGHAKLRRRVLYCEYGEYCDACQLAVTVIMSSDAAVKSCIEKLTMSYIIQTKEIL